MPYRNNALELPRDLSLDDLKTRMRHCAREDAGGENFDEALMERLDRLERDNAELKTKLTKLAFELDLHKINPLNYGGC